MDKLPRHVAIIMDGNGRWAKERGLSRSEGHRAGTEAVRNIIRACDELGIEALTLYAFSTENWSRPEPEVAALMSLLLIFFRSEIDELNAKNVKIRILGDVSGLPEPQREAVCDAMRITERNTGLKLNIALNYGSRAELVRAVRALAERGQEITESAVSDALDTAGLPDPDLIIRTSGEQRLSNFLLWQSAYAELIFNPVYWPDYTKEVFLADLKKYERRSRRFGGVESVTK